MLIFNQYGRRRERCHESVFSRENKLWRNVQAPNRIGRQLVLLGTDLGHSATSRRGPRRREASFVGGPWLRAAHEGTSQSPTACRCWRYRGHLSHRCCRCHPARSTSPVRFRSRSFPSPARQTSSFPRCPTASVCRLDQGRRARGASSLGRCRPHDSQCPRGGPLSVTVSDPMGPEDVMRM